MTLIKKYFENYIYRKLNYVKFFIDAYTLNTNNWKN